MGWGSASAARARRGPAHQKSRKAGLARLPSSIVTVSAPAFHVTSKFVHEYDGVEPRFMQRKPPAGRGSLDGATDGVTKAVNVPAGAAAAALGVVDGVSVPVEPAAPALGVVDGVPVPVGVALGVGVPVGVPECDAPAAGVELALAPAAGRLADHTPPQRTYAAGHAVLPDCWQHVKSGAAALAG